MTHEFTLTKTTLKNGKFKYVVTNQEGTIVSNRTSSREYVACTADGQFYFGRLDLIGKGDHGRYINRAMSDLAITAERWEKIKSMYVVGCTLERIKNFAQERLIAYNQIAYLNQ